MYTAVFPDADESLNSVLSDHARALVPDMVVHYGTPDRDGLIARLQGHAVMLNNESYVDETVLAACPSLRAIVFLGTGAASYVDLDACARRDIPVRTISGYGDRSVAEHAIGLLFAVFRQIAELDRELRGGVWKPRAIAEIGGKTLGVVGLGPIGAEVARMGSALGMKVLGWNRSPLRQSLPVELVELDELLARSDAVSLHIGLNDGTRGMFGPERLRRMKRGAILINTARAALTDEATLLAMLCDGHLRGAGLDVFHKEPLPAENPLRALSNVVLTPHSGWSSPEAAKRQMDSGYQLMRTELDRLRGINSANAA